MLQGGDSHEAHGQVPWGWPSGGAGPVLLIGLTGGGSQQSRVGPQGQVLKGDTGARLHPALCHRDPGLVSAKRCPPGRPGLPGASAWPS